MFSFLWKLPVLLVAALLLSSSVASAASPQPIVKISGPSTVTAGKSATFKVVINVAKGQNVPKQWVWVSNYMDNLQYTVDQKARVSLDSSGKHALPEVDIARLASYALWGTDPLGSGSHTWYVTLTVLTPTTYSGSANHSFCLGARTMVMLRAAFTTQAVQMACAKLVSQN